MRIAQVSPLYESVPPQHYGGTERIVSHLTEELVAQGEAPEELPPLRRQASSPDHRT